MLKLAMFSYIVNAECSILIVNLNDSSLTLNFQHLFSILGAFTFQVDNKLRKLRIYSQYNEHLRFFRNATAYFIKSIKISSFDAKPNNI